MTLYEERWAREESFPDGTRHLLFLMRFCTESKKLCVNFVLRPSSIFDLAVIETPADFADILDEYAFVRWQHTSHDLNENQRVIDPIDEDYARLADPLDFAKQLANDFIDVVVKILSKTYELPDEESEYEYYIKIGKKAQSMLSDIKIEENDINSVLRQLLSTDSPLN